MGVLQEVQDFEKLIIRWDKTRSHYVAESVHSPGIENDSVPNQEDRPHEVPGLNPRISATTVGYWVILPSGTSHSIVCFEVTIPSPVWFTTRTDAKLPANCRRMHVPQAAELASVTFSDAPIDG